MKFNRSTLVFAAMMFGSLSAMGCKSKAEDTATEATEQGTAAPAAEPVKAAAQTTRKEQTTIFAKTSVGAAVQVPAPPVPRVEYPGPAPSREHFWAHGYWQWDGPRTSYTWVPGHWAPQYAPIAPPAPRYEDPGRPPSERHFWVHGYWKWNGREYLWVGGHWDTQRGGYEYVHPHWDNVNGRWRHIPGHWVARR